MQSKIVKTLVLSVLILFLFTGVAAAQEWVVTAPGDVDKINTSLINLDNMTLREAIVKANSGDTIVFSDNISKVNLSYGTLNLSKDLTIGGNTKVVIARDASPLITDFRIFTVTGGNVVFKQLTLENGFVLNGTGGAVLADRANVTFDTCTIQNNKGGSGGGIYVTNGSNVKFATSSLFSNVGSIDGSAIFIQNGNVEMQNTIIDGHNDRYNIVKLEKGKLVANQSRIINCIVSENGSPVNASAGTILEFRNSTFSNNTGKNSGGIITSGTLLVENCVFNGSTTSGSGGGIALKNGSIGTIKYSIFSNSNVSDDGGGIHIDAGAVATIDTCTFINNIANYGGAFFNRGTVNANAITAVNNTAKFYGGAVALWNDGNATLTKSVLSGNTAKSNNTNKDTGGGGLNVSSSQAVLSNNVIVGNTDPREVDFSESNASIKSGGNNLVGTYKGTGKFPIDSTDVSGIQLTDVFVIENGLPALTRSTGYTAGYDKVQVYTVALNSSSDNPAANILGGTNQTPTPEPPGENGTNQTPDPEPPAESGSWTKYLMYGAIIVILLVVIVVGIVAFLKYREKNQYKFG